MKTTKGRPRAIVATTVAVTASTFLPELIRQLSIDHEVHVVSSPGPQLADLGARLGVSTHELPMTRNISPRNDLGAAVRWLRLLAAVRPSVVVTATPKASLLGMMTAAVSRVPERTYLLVGLRLEGESGFRRRLLAVMERLTAHAASRVVANSPSLMQAAVDLRLVSRTHITSTCPGSDHGVDSSRFAPSDRDEALLERLGLRRSDPVVGFVGRITHDKGLDTLVDAAAILRARGLKAQYLVVGSADEPDSPFYLRRFSNDPSTFVHVAHADDVRPYYALMDLHVLPTLREGFPNVVLEAAAMAIPTVTTTATGAVDSVRHGETGLIVPVQNATALADAIEQLLRDPTRKAAMGAAARRRVVSDFRPELIVASILTPSVTS